MSMLPLISSPFPEKQIPHTTWNIDFEHHCLTTFIDEEYALKQSVFLLLSTPRFEHLIYSFQYGSTLGDVIGKDYHTVVTLLPSKLKETLLGDSRILDVKEFQFTNLGDGISASFTVLWAGGSFRTSTTI